MNLLVKVRKSLRISTDSFDDELQDLIDACKLDLELSGIVVDETNPLTAMAITVYSKANFGLENPDFDKFNKSYDSLKTHLALSGTYNGNV